MNNNTLQFKEQWKQYENYEKEYLDCLTQMQTNSCSNEKINELTTKIERKNAEILSLLNEQGRGEMLHEEYNKLLHDKKRIEMIQKDTSYDDSSMYLIHQRYLYMFSSLLAILMVFYTCKWLLFPGPISILPLVLIVLSILFISYIS
jgi:hypothetical protein